MSKEVLIVDDDRALAKSLARAIEDAGYPTRCVHDGSAALEEINRSRPGLVLLDLLLPRLDGRGVLSRLRSGEATQDLPVLVITGVFRGRAHAQELEEAGAQGFLEKPFRRTDLVAYLSRHLGRPISQDAEGQSRSEDGRLSLVEKPILEVIWDTMQRGFTGVVRFESGKQRKVLVFESGRPTHIFSNLARECLGNRLLAAGHIDARALQESLRRARSGEGRQGEILVRLGAVSEALVERALVTQAEEKLFDLLSWSDGEAWHEEGVREVPLASALPQWSPRKTILRGATMMSRARIERILKPFRPEPVARTELELSAEELAEPGVQALLSDVDGTHRVENLSLEHAPMLYALRLIGALSFGEAKSGPTEMAAPATQEELEELLEQQQTQSHFEVLGIEQSTPPAELRRAFVKLAKLYHPDRYAAESEETHRLAAEVFARIVQAHDTLVDPEVRKAYVSGLRKGVEEGKGPQVAQIVTAEVQFRKGEAHFRKREYGDALEHFKWAIELNPQEGEFRAFYGWAFYLVNQNDEKAAKTAGSCLTEAAELAPNCVNVYYFHGLLRKACGDSDGAERMFRKVLELSPSHAEANREIRLFAMRRERGAGPSGGRIGRGRKKR